MLRLTVALLPSARFPVVVASFGSCDPLALPAVGVGQPASCAAHPATVGSCKPRPSFVATSSLANGPRRVSAAAGVGHPVQTLPDVRRADARRAQIGGPHGISQCFQVRTYSGEP